MALRRSKSRSSKALPPIVFRWDLDKTYLESEFESLRQMVRIPFEKPEDKVAVPGVVPLIRNLREVATSAGREVRVYFISASPPQIAKAIKEKLTLDGIVYDGIVFKNQLHHLVRGRFRNLREHVGYKLTELLKSRRDMPPESRELLFGDDWESDPLIYSLYADLLAGRLAAEDLDSILKPIGVDARLLAVAKDLVDGLAAAEVVRKIFINVERRTPPTRFRSFGPRLVPTFNYFQTAACLYDDGYLTLPAVAEVAAGLVEATAATPHRFANALDDITRRGHLRPASATVLREYLREHRLLPRQSKAARPSLWQRLQSWFASTPEPTPPRDEAIDYQALIAQWRGAHTEQRA